MSRPLGSLFLALAVLVLSGCVPGQHEPKPRAEGGVFDLRGPELADGRVVALDGEWEFYWNRLLTPDDFHGSGKSPEMSGFFSLPGTWRGHRLGDKKLGSTGQATYRIRLLTDGPTGRLTLRVFDIHEAYRLWADGKLIAQSGVPGGSAATESPARTLKLVEIPLEGRSIELVLQVSNYHFRMGGVTEPMLVARPGPLETAQTRSWSISLFFAGCMLVVGVYHLGLYCWRRQDVAPLSFGLYCLLAVGYSVTANSSGWVVSTLLPGWNSASMEVFSLSCFVCWASLLYRFFKTIYPDEFHTLPVYFLDARIAVYTILLIFAPGLPLYWFISLCLVQTFIYAGYYLHRVALCVRRKRAGSGILLVGLLIQFIAGVNDPLVHMGLLKSVYLIEPAVFLFIFSQALVLSKRFSKAFGAVERLSMELEQKNLSLQTEMKERNRLEKEIVNISENERRQMGHELHDSLCQQLTGARLRATAMSHEQAGDKDGSALAELTELLKMSTRDAYRIARGLWPVEHGKNGPSLENLARSIAKATGIRVACNRRCKCDECANENITTLYRIAQEALANAAKHAEARNIDVELDCCGRDFVTLTVQDDGVWHGSSRNEDGGLGISIMRHRARMIGAHLKIGPGPQGGTRLTCTAPCQCAFTPNGEGENDG